jgi:Neuraminidase (sialidase)
LSTDNGRTWQQHRVFTDAEKFKIRPERAILCTRDGTVILAFANDAEREFTGWDVNTHDTRGTPVLPTYVVRSTDGGKTWEPPQKLHDDWTGAIRDMIQTKDGTVVFTSMMLRHKPGRHTVVTYASKDDGRTWHRSNVIDLGGIGHHGGVTEATIVQLADGRLLMLSRTNWGKLWRSFSEDDGMTWMPIGPSEIDASAAPAILERLQSGRIFLAWNRYYYEGTDQFKPYGGDGHATGTPTSLQRQELSVAFTEDEGQTWSDPVVVARVPKNHDGTWLKSQVSYPYVFERRPGEIWLTTWAGGLRAKLQEKDFVGPLERTE